MSDEKNQQKEEKEKKPPFHEVLINLMTNDEKVSEMPGMENLEGWEQVVITANVLASGRVPEEAVPAVKEAALKAWENEKGDEDARAALENLAKELGFKLLEEESQEEKPEK